MNQRLRNWLATAPSGAFALFATVAAFSTYFCMYAFRKPVSAGSYAELSLPVLGIEFDYKVIILFAQLIGYTLSKFSGIKFVSELKPERRVMAIFLAIGVAWVALLLFALVPHPYNWVFLFFNGLPLGMIWGFVFSFIEGRRLTEILGAGMAASFIIGSGVVKGVGLWLISTFGIPEFWMPFATGGVFLVPLMVSVWMLSVLPPQSEADIASRTLRKPMTGADRRAFFQRFALGIIMLVSIFVVLTAFRDFRDNFQVDIWQEVLIQNNTLPEGASLAEAADEIADRLASIETYIGFAVTALLGLAILIRNSRWAFLGNLLMLAFNSVMLIICTQLFEAGQLSAEWWMGSIGFWMYLSYVSYHNVLFERFITVFRVESNIGFLMYIADAFGYLGSASLWVYQQLGPSLSWLDFFLQISYYAGFGMLTLSLIALGYFSVKMRGEKKELSPAA